MKKRILIVEDDLAILDGFRIVLERAGFIVEYLTDGTKLIDGDFNTPDLIIMDKQLAGIDGLDICRHLKMKAETSYIPIIMTSASPHVVHLAESAMADGFIEKPFNNDLVVALIKKHLP